MLAKIDTYFDGEYWCAMGVSGDIITKGETYDELLMNIKEAVTLYFEDQVEKCKSIEVPVMCECEVSGNLRRQECYHNSPPCAELSSSSRSVSIPFTSSSVDFSLFLQRLIK